MFIVTFTRLIFELWNNPKRIFMFCVDFAVFMRQNIVIIVAAVKRVDCIHVQD